MPDSAQFIPQSSSRDRASGCRRRRSAISDVQIAIQGAAAELRRLDHRLAEISKDLPLPDDGFEMLSELRSAVDCVRADLLADAIETLNTISTASEIELRRRSTERQSWLIAAVV